MLNPGPQMHIQNTFYYIFTSLVSSVSSFTYLYQKTYLELVIPQKHKKMLFYAQSGAPNAY